MATPNLVNLVAGETILLTVSADGGNTYVAPALINTTRGVTWTLATNEDELVDTNNPSNPAQVIRSAKSIDTKLDGAGTLDGNSVLSYTSWMSTGVARPCKLVTNLTGATANTVTISGNYFLTSFQITGERAKKATCSLTLEQASGPTVTNT